MATPKSWRYAALAAATLLALTACNKSENSEEAQKAAAAAKAAHVPSVNVVTVKPENVLIETELPGRLEAIRSACLKKAPSSARASRCTNWTTQPTAPRWKTHAPAC